MTRHFLQLYLLIVLTLAAVSWGQERLWQMYGQQSAADIAAENPAQAALLRVVESQLHSLPAEQRSPFIHTLARDSGVDVELFALKDVTGDAQASLARGEPGYMSGSDGRAWVLKRIGDDGSVLAFRFNAHEPRRGVLDWSLAFIFYAAIALVIMMWLWPLRRDLRQLEQSTSTFGDGNWQFNTSISSRSQVHPLAEAFKRMATRIDGLVRSQRDLSNAMSHEIKTPLARMRFDVEMARTATEPAKVAEHLDSINTNIAELNSFVTATLDYAILERAEVALNITPHDLTQILPAMTEAVRRGSRTELRITCEVDPAATAVFCDAHLMETVLRNLLHNALRYAKQELRVTFQLTTAASAQLCVADDGPGIPVADRERVFGSFVRLDQPEHDKGGFGLGLAIVKRMMEWHGGSASVGESPLGGARFCVEWPHLALKESSINHKEHTVGR
ncbi:MAG TPA: ATP-binding protein [Povalibacter sp.]|jgi:two-component system, OmpR family, sensor kinase